MKKFLIPLSFLIPHSPLLILLLALPASAQIRQAGWSWEMPVAQYQRLDFTQRSSIDRAADLFRNAERKISEAMRGHNVAQNEREALPLFRAAGAEYKRFEMEFAASAPEQAMGYAKLMQALAQHFGKNRYAAITSYSEVMDLYEEIPDLHAPALYWRGQAHFENSENAKGMADWQSMVENPDLRSHPLVSAALGSMANDAWLRGNWEEAASRWKRACEANVETARDFADFAIATKYLMLTGYLNRWNEITQFFENMELTEKQRVEYINRYIDLMWHRMDWGREYFSRATKTDAERDAKIRECLLRTIDWYGTWEQRFIDEGGEDRQWEHTFKSLWYRINIDRSNPAVKEYLTKIAAKVRAIPEADKRQWRACQLMHHLRSARMITEARLMLDCVEDRNERLWQAAHIEESGDNFKEANEFLKQLQNSKEAVWVTRAKEKQAWICHHRISDYETAIKLYTELANPPGSLWNIADCQRRWGKKKEAHNTLTEIASIFPNDAARAMFTRAEWYFQDDERDNAIALYRRILANNEWRKSGESSQAHQRLEKLGLLTGGGEGTEAN